MARDRHRQAWEDWATIDPLWAVLTADEGRHGQWDRDRFFAVGRDHVNMVLASAGNHDRPERFGSALDFGCGVGRLTRALTEHFDDVLGLDISSGMISEAERLDGGSSGAKFRVHDREDLGAVPTASIDFVLSLLVLQHLPSTDAIKTYLREFVRVLTPGGVAAVQLPIDVPVPPPRQTLRQRIAFRSHVLQALRHLGVSRRFLYRHTQWMPDMPMTAIPRDETVAVFEEAGGRVARIDPPSFDGAGVTSCVYYVVPAAASAASR